MIILEDVNLLNLFNDCRIFNFFKYFSNISFMFILIVDISL